MSFEFYEKFFKFNNFSFFQAHCDTEGEGYLGVYCWAEAVFDEWIFRDTA